eukprot:610066-Pleurochrysis_carterae.AAC.7
MGRQMLWSVGRCLRMLVEHRSQEPSPWPQSPSPPQGKVYGEKGGTPRENGRRVALERTKRKCQAHRARWHKLLHSGIATSVVATPAAGDACLYWRSMLIPEIKADQK